MGDLAERLREANGDVDRELDAEIAEAFGHKIEWLSTSLTMEMEPVIRWQAPHPYAGMREPCPRYTTSIDAAVALTEAAIPGCLVDIHTGSPAEATIHPPLGDKPNAEAHTPALALCLALVEWRNAHD